MAQRHKDLREEVKLHTLIQLATITALGALMGVWPKTDDVSKMDGWLIKTLILSVALILLTVGGMYNIVGNYYSYIANYKLGRKDQEAVVTPWLRGAQNIIAVFLGIALAIIAWEGGCNLCDYWVSKHAETKAVPLKRVMVELESDDKGFGVKRVHTDGQAAVPGGTGIVKPKADPCFDILVAELLVVVIVLGAIGGGMVYYLSVRRVVRLLTDTSTCDPTMKVMREDYKLYLQGKRAVR